MYTVQFKATVCFPKYVQEIYRGLPCLQQVFAQQHLPYYQNFRETWKNEVYQLLI